LREAGLPAAALGSTTVTSEPMAGLDLIRMLPLNDFTLSRMLKRPKPPSIESAELLSLTSKPAPSSATIVRTEFPSSMIRILAAVSVGLLGGGIGFQDASVSTPHKKHDVPAVGHQQLITAEPFINLLVHENRPRSILSLPCRLCGKE
jgi:hypothetical protein